MQKPLSAIWNCLLKLVFFSGAYVYVQLFHFNGNEITEPTHRSLRNIKWHLEAFASELFKYSLFEEQNLSKKE